MTTALAAPSRAATPPAAANGPLVRFVGIGKTYDGITRVVDDLDLDIARGEFLTLLGPSGSGKTTTLMMLAGFETPTGGRDPARGQAAVARPAAPAQHRHGVPELRAVPAHDRRREHRLSAVGARQCRRRHRASASSARSTWCSCAGFGARRPAQLSGGQQQRVAVARALVFEPKLVLMDEPLGALDKQLREQMQLEIRRLHQRLGVTMVYVTHDQSEALTMSDRIAVFHRGRIQQLDTPERMYEAPANAFVARFIGENNRLEGTVESDDDGRCTIRLAGGDARSPACWSSRSRAAAPRHASLRPERVQIRSAGHTIDATRLHACGHAARDHLSRRPRARARRHCRVATNSWSSVRSREAHLLPPIGAAVDVSWRPSIAARSRGKASGRPAFLPWRPVCKGK